MTLRLRLVAALVALATVGLAVFGVTTYSLYARSQYDRLDSQLTAALPLARTLLAIEAGLGPRAPGILDQIPTGPQGQGGGGPSVVLPPGAYAEMRTRGGGLFRLQVSSTDAAVPALPVDLGATPSGQLFSTGSVEGSTRWRVLAVDAGRSAGVEIAVAIPLDDVRASLNRLILIEAAAAVGLLAALAAGSWLILRRGLRPLEQMATAARAIDAGDLSLRVRPDDGRSEVGQLGAALNTMLDEIEGAFHQRDETERKLRQFLADASHELRTPLTSIQGFAELFRLEGQRDHVDLEVIMRRIEQESSRMRTLVEDLLLLARLDETRTGQQVPVDLAVLAADACSDAVAADPDRPVTLSAPAPVVVLGDRDHLRQAMANLVTNALRHTPPGTRVEVATEIVDGQAEVRVRDHGPGLDEATLAHAFDRFWQADAARRGTGAGLGLSIVAGIAREHGGQATAANAPGGGALFTLTLPVATAPT